MTDIKKTLIGLAEVQSTMLITDENRSKIIRAINDLKKLQAENENLKKQNSELFILKERFKARNHKALDYLYSEDCDSAYNARCALEGGHHE